MNKNKTYFLVFVLALVLALSSCASVTSTSVKAQEGGSINKNAVDTVPNLKKVISVAKFNTSMAEKNQSSAYSAAAYDTLVNKLQGTGKFIVYEESEFDTLNTYRASTGGEKLKKRLAQYMIVGTVNSVANKTTGGGGGLGFIGIATNTTTVQASVTLRLIDTSTGQIIYSEEGQGNSKNTSASVGIEGWTVSGSGYGLSDLEEKAIGAAIDSLINNIIETCDQDPWKTNLITDNGVFYIIGGESMGIKAGTVFDVYKKGSTITNPQTGSEIELPGEKVAEATVIQTFPAALPEDEISMITINNNVIDVNNPSNYVIREQN